VHNIVRVKCYSDFFIFWGKGSKCYE